MGKRLTWPGNEANFTVLIVAESNWLTFLELSRFRCRKLRKLFFIEFKIFRPRDGEDISEVCEGEEREREEDGR